MIRKILLVMMTIMMMPTMAWAQSGSDEILVEDLQRNANKGYSQLSGYEFEMALWAYYCINGAEDISINYTEAVKILLKLVAREKNDVSAEQFQYVVEGYNLLGDCYEKGMGVKKDINTAKIWWQLAAIYDNKKAQAKLDQYSVPTTQTKTEPKEAPKPEPKPTSKNGTQSSSKNKKIFTAVEQKAMYPGGDVALLNYVNSHVQYPIMAVEEGIQGRVVVRFVVEIDGTIGKVEVLRGKHVLLDSEAVRVVKTIPEEFIPAKQNGEPVRCWYTIPVTFKLQE